MPERIKPGWYELGTVESSTSRDPPRNIGVIKGEAANEARGQGFGRFIGLSSSKWYIYEQEEHLRKYNDRSGTGVLDVVSLESEYNSKKKAVDVAKKRYNL